MPRSADIITALGALERAYLIGVDDVAEVWLIRHADVYEAMADVPDPPLSRRGHTEAKRLADRLHGLRIGAVYASPLRRALETARAVTPDVHVDDRLVEAHADYPNGVMRVEEDPAAIIRRMDAAVNEAAATHSGQRIVMVSHGIAILTYLCHILHLERGALRVFPVATSISIVRIKDGRKVVGTLCDVAHLERAE